MGDFGGTERIILEGGIDWSSAKEGSKVVLATIADLNRVTDQYSVKTNAQLTEHQAKIKAAAQAAVNGAMQAAAAERQKQEVLERETKQLQQQVAAQQQSITLANSTLATQEKQLAAMTAQTQQLQAQVAQMKQLATQQQQAAGSGTRMFGGGGGQGGGGIGATGLLAGAGRGLFGGNLFASLFGAQLLERGVERFIQKLREASREASSLVLIEDQFKRIAKAAGIDAAGMIHKMRVETEGLIGGSQLMKVATTALKSPYKLTTDEIAQLTGAVVRLAEANGKTATQAMESLNRALQMGRVQVLANVTGLTRLGLTATNVAPGLGRVASGTIQLRHGIEEVLKAAERLGEQPLTFEQMLKRISILWEGLYKSFGKGFNLSAGMQAAGQLIKEMIGNTDNLTSAAQKFGEVIGDAFSAAIIAARGFLPVAKEVFGAIGNLVSIFSVNFQEGKAKVLGSSPGFTGPIQGDVASRKVEAAHPELSQAVYTIIEFNRVLSVAAGIVGIFTQAVADFIGKETASKSARDVAEYGIGSSGARLGGGGLGSVLMGGLTTALGYTVRPALRMAAGRAEELREPTAPPKDIYQIIDEANKRADEQKTSFTTSILKADSRKESAGIPLKQPDADPQTRATKARLQLELQLQRDLAKLLMGERQAQIDDQKAQEQEAYRAGESEAAHHFQRLRELEEAAFNARKAEAGMEYTAKLDDLDELEKLDLAQEQPPEKKEETIKTYELKREHERNAHNVRLQGLERQHKTAMRGIDAQDIADDRTAQVKRINAASALQQEGLKAQGALQSRQFARGNITPDEFFDAEIARANKTAEIQKKLAQDVFAAGPDNKATQAVRDDAILKATQAREEAITRIIDTESDKRLQYVEKQYAAYLQFTEAQLQSIQAEAPGAATGRRQIPAIQNIIGAEAQRRDALVRESARMFETGEGQGDQWDKINIDILKANDSIAKYVELLRQARDTSKFVGEGFGTVGTAIGQVFTSKFAQNLSQTIGIGARGLEQSGLRRETIVSDLKKIRAKGTEPAEKAEAFADALKNGVGAVVDFVTALTSAKSAVAGGIGGAVAGAGIGNTLGPLFKMMGIGGPAGQLIGAGVGAVAGIITGSKEAAVKKHIDDLNRTFKSVMLDFSRNNNNLQNTIDRLQQLLTHARDLQADSKKGGAEYQKAIDQYIDQINQLQTQQLQTLRQLDQQLAILSAPQGVQDLLGNLQQILDKYNSFAGAARNADDLAKANQYLVQSLKAYDLQAVDSLAESEETAINDALQLNDLLYQRQQANLQYSQQIMGILGQGLVTRQATRGQNEGQQLQQLQQAHDRQMEQLNHEIDVASYKVSSEANIFNLATTRIGLEAQLLQLQSRQTDLDMARIVALQGLVNQLATGDFAGGPLGALISTIPSVNVPGGASSSPLQALMNNFEALVEAAYQNRASLGYGAFRGTNL